jgi:tRNA-binding EMAP/Myf-like protein
MLMLRHVYRTSPRLLEKVLQSLLDEDEVEIGPRFAQQVGAAHSIPDAVLNQQPLHIYIEAKHGDGLYDDQLERHMESIADKNHPENSAFLIGLTTNSTSEQESERWTKKAFKQGIAFATTTYQELLAALNTVCAHDPDLQEILEDYQIFIGGENLLPNQHRKLVAMLCGQSWQENVLNGAYFEPAHRNPKWTRAHFLGIYRQKQISYVGRIVSVAVCRKADSKLIVETEDFGSLTKEHKDRIHAIIDAATYYPGLAAESHRYYMVDSFAQTEVRKISSGGMMGHRYFDITALAETNELQKDASSTEVANMLKGAIFE